jgi:sulfur carrier protein ThiS adenylyltransferase
MFQFSDVNRFYYTEDQIQKLKNTRIGIAGAGGLGSNCALALIRCGFDNFIIADFDIVSVSNLNRQQYLPSDIDKPKVECLRRNLLAINPDITCEIYRERVTASNAHEIFGSCTCIIEAFDNAESKAMIVNEFLTEDKLVVSASGLGGHGQSDRIITRKIRNNFYLIGDSVSEVGISCKPYAPCVMIAAAKEADVVLDWVLGKK